MVFYLVVYLPIALLLLVALLLIGLAARWLNPTSELLRRKLLSTIMVTWGICGLGGILWRSYLTHTTYALYYSERNFKQITIGMSKQQVLSLVGDPLDKWLPYRDNPHFPERQQYVGFVYSKSENKNDYELRQINFDNDKVAEIKSYTYYD